MHSVLSVPGGVRRGWVGRRGLGLYQVPNLRNWKVENFSHVGDVMARMDRVTYTSRWSLLKMTRLHWQHSKDKTPMTTLHLQQTLPAVNWQLSIEKILLKTVHWQHSIDNIIMTTFYWQYSTDNTQTDNILLTILHWHHFTDNLLLTTDSTLPITLQWQHNIKVTLR